MVKGMNETNSNLLERIKDTHRRSVRLSTESIDYLIKQAERVLESENEREEYKRLHKSYLDKFASTVGERNRLREAINQALEKHKWNNEESARILEQALEVSK